jgi:uncharacterized protein
MKLILRELSVSALKEDKHVLFVAIQKLNIKKDDVKSFFVLRKALDARNKSDIKFKYSIVIDIDTPLAKKLINEKNLSEYNPKKQEEIVFGDKKINGRPVIIGAGPCGLFAAYTMAKLGFKPLIIERGKNIDDRKKDIRNLQKNAVLNPESNICFGEGGAGTFSDGKLTTRSKDLRAREVLKTLVKCGANEEILTLAKPHLGTDGMQKIVINLRKEIIFLGGEILFEAKLCDIDTEKDEITGIKYQYKDEVIDLKTNVVVIATGHSAKDTYRMLFKSGVSMENKACAIGFRIEHKREFIDKAQFGEFAGNKNLGAAEYALSAKSEGRGVYSFCMCPGGVVVCSSSSEGELCTNGMSYGARDMENSNSAIVVSLYPSDSEDHPLGGLDLIEDIEKKAFEMAGGYIAPIQRAIDFIEGKTTVDFIKTKPSYRPGIIAADLNGLMPSYIEKGIKTGLKVFDKRIRGFIENGVLTGVETRTSSPVRITRSESLESINIKGLMPAGEGAGYAGGIISAAVDGMKIGESIAKMYSPD